MGSPIPQDFRYKDFYLEPACTGVGTEIEYKVTNGNGGKPPAYVVWNKADRIIQIIDDPTMVPGKLQIVLTGTLMDLKAQLIFIFNIVPEKTKVTDIYLSPVSLSVNADPAAPILFRS